MSILFMVVAIGLPVAIIIAAFAKLVKTVEELEEAGNNLKSEVEGLRNELLTTKKVEKWVK